MATSIFKSLHRTGTNLLAKNNRWGSRLLASKKSQKRVTMFNYNIKSVFGTRQYSKDVKKEDSVATTDNIFLKGDMRSKLDQILQGDKQGIYFIFGAIYNILE